MGGGAGDDPTLGAPRALARQAPAVKFSNTLVVKNHRTFFTDEVMYMSGGTLHVLTLNLVQKFRKQMRAEAPLLDKERCPKGGVVRLPANIPISFSAGRSCRV